MSVNKVMGVMRTQLCGGGAHARAEGAVSGRGGVPAQYRRGTDAGRALRHFNTLRKA